MNAATDPDNQDVSPKPAVNPHSLRRLVRRIFPAPWMALMILGSIVMCVLQGNYLAAWWAFIAGLGCLGSNQDSPANITDRNPKMKCPHCNSELLWSDDRGAHCDGCDEFNNETDSQAPSAPPGGSVDGCDHCDTFGGLKTYANQARLPLNGNVVCVDWCIHGIVAALNAGGVQTSACCCGHGRVLGRIDLADGRILRIENPLSEKLGGAANANES